ncbi:hypothetical protein RB595_000209 [Gaeumannomyces hyphopodioides]
MSVHHACNYPHPFELQPNLFSQTTIFPSELSSSSPFYLPPLGKMAKRHRLLFALLSLLTIVAQCLPITSPNNRYSVSRLLVRGTKRPSFKVCGKFATPFYSYSSSSELADTVKTYGPRNMNVAKDTQFGTLNTASVKNTPGFTKNFASEHILEYQTMFSSHGFWGIIQSLPDPISPTHAKYGEKIFLIDGKQERLPPWMVKYWGPKSKEITIDTITGKPMEILSEAYPKNGKQGLVLLDSFTNGIKEIIEAPGKKSPRSDTTMDRYMKTPGTSAKAFFALKHTMFAIEYMVTPDIYRAYHAQTLREAKYMAAIENLRENDKSDGIYQKQAFDKAWEAFVGLQNRRSLAKTIAWLVEWGPTFINQYKKKGSPDMVFEDSKGYLAIVQELEMIKVADPVQSVAETEDEEDAEKDTEADAIPDGIPPWIGSHSTSQSGSTQLPPSTPAKTHPRPKESTPPAPKKPAANVDDLDSKFNEMNINSTPSKPPPAAIPVDQNTKFDSADLEDFSAALRGYLTSDWIVEKCNQWKAAGKYYGWEPSGGGNSGGGSAGGGEEVSKLDLQGGKGGGSGSTKGGSGSTKGGSGSTGGGSGSTGGGGKGDGKGGSAQGQNPNPPQTGRPSDNTRNKNKNNNKGGSSGKP